MYVIQEADPMNKTEAKRIFIVTIFIGIVFSAIAMLIKYPANLDSVNQSTLSIYTQYGEFRRYLLKNIILLLLFP